MKTPTDLQILEAIYAQVIDRFPKFDDKTPDRSSKIYVPFEIDSIAKLLGVDSDIVFGRLYYHLENKYGYKQDDGSFVHFFAINVGSDRHCINVPLLSGTVAMLREEKKRASSSFGFSLAALIISILTFGLNAGLKIREEISKLDQTNIQQPTQSIERKDK